jgi:hypothetical protein
MPTFRFPSLYLNALPAPPTPSARYEARCILHFRGENSNTSTGIIVICTMMRRGDACYDLLRPRLDNGTAAKFELLEAGRSSVSGRCVRMKRRPCAVTLRCVRISLAGHP